LGSSDNNVIRGNIIGPLMGSCTFNGYRGVDIEGGSTGNIVGGTGAGQGNKISGNDYWGIEVKEVGSIGNIISGNSMSCNAYSAVDVNTGGNNNILPPVITAASGTSVSGTSTVNAVIEIFRAQDATSFGCVGTPIEQGADYLGSVTADGTGNWTMTGSFSGNLVVTQRTVVDGSSSFSNAFSTGITPLWTNGCAGPVIPIGPAPTANFSSTPSTICEGECIDFADLSTDSPTSWSWTFVGGSPSSSITQDQTVCYTAPGVYTVDLSATNANGTGTITQSITVNVLPTATIAQDGNLLIATPGHPGYQWYLNGTILPGETNDTLVMTTNGDYTCEVSGANNCVNLSSVLTISDIGFENYLLSEIKLYPNPASTNICIDLGQTSDLFSKITITDISGNVVFTTSINADTKQIFNVESLADGIYFVQLVGDENYVVRFCKE